MQRGGDVTWKTFLRLFFGFMAIYIGSCSSSPRLESIAVTPPNGDVSKGLTQQFKATGTYSNGSTQDLSQSASWTSSDTTIVTIAAGGLATTVATGTATIQASQGTVTGSTKFTVASAAVVSIAVAPANPGSLSTSSSSGVTIPQGVPVQLAATATLTDQSTQDVTGGVTWNSTATNVASITPAGVVTGLMTGQAAIQATLGTVQGSSNLTVDSAALVEVVVTPQNPSISDSGATQPFAAAGYFSDGSNVDVTSQVGMVFDERTSGQRERHRTGHERAPAQWSVRRIYLNSSSHGNCPGCFHLDRHESYGEWIRRSFYAA